MQLKKEQPLSEHPSQVEPFDMPSSQPLLLRALRFEALATLALLLTFGVIGYFAAGTPGVIGGVIGAILAGLLSAITIGSIAFANHRFIDNPNYVVIFFALVTGSWLFKLIAFITAVVLLRDQSWLDTRILFFALVAGILVSLVVDVFVATRSRMPYVSDPSK